MAWSCVRAGSGWILAKGSLPPGQVLEQAPQGSDHSTKPTGIQEVFGQCSQK